MGITNKFKKDKIKPVKPGDKPGIIPGVLSVKIGVIKTDNITEIIHYHPFNGPIESHNIHISNFGNGNIKVKYHIINSPDGAYRMILTEIDKLTEIDILPAFFDEEVQIDIEATTPTITINNLRVSQKLKLIIVAPENLGKIAEIDIDIDSGEDPVIDPIIQT